MSAEVGIAIVDVLECAGKEHIGYTAPEVYEAFLWQIRGADTVRLYDGTDVYWRRVQATVDFFFTAEQRAGVWRHLSQRDDLFCCAQCRRFRELACAEARLATLLRDLGLAGRGARRRQQRCVRPRNVLQPSERA
ncbi:MAG: hypothetical protein AAF637_26950 [Pseudomonadota bacterium]